MLGCTRRPSRLEEGSTGLERHPNDTSHLWLKDSGDTGPVASGIEVLSTDEDGRVSWKEVTAVTRHPVVNKDGSDTLIEVETESGRVVDGEQNKTPSCSEKGSTNWTASRPCSRPRWTASIQSGPPPPDPAHPAGVAEGAGGSRVRDFLNPAGGSAYFWMGDGTVSQCQKHLV